MLLAIDSGNTNFVFAVYDGEEMRGAWRATSNASRTADEYAVWLSQLMALEGLKSSDIDGAIIASVVPTAVFPLTQLCRRYFHTEPMVVGDPGIDLGINIVMDHPESVGADRLVNAVAAHARYGGPAIVLDFGTATSFDVVGKDGSYLGGVLAPGVNLSLEAFAMAAAKLPRITVRRPERVIGKATVPAMESGVYWGYVGLVEGLISRIQEEFGEPMKVIATGGLAPLFEKAVPAIVAIDSDLTLRGLRLIHTANSGTTASKSDNGA